MTCGKRSCRTEKPLWRMQGRRCKRRKWTAENSWSLSSRVCKTSRNWTTRKTTRRECRLQTKSSTRTTTLSQCTMSRLKSLCLDASKRWSLSTILAIKTLSWAQTKTALMMNFARKTLDLECEIALTKIYPWLVCLKKNLSTKISPHLWMMVTFV